MSMRLYLVLASSVSADTCGGGGGESCGSWFSSFDCPGTCCHDMFNTWCCPSGPWECAGWFQSGAHCDVTNACQCTDNTYYITKVTASGTPTIVADPAWDLNECCDAEQPTECGWGDFTSITWVRSTQMTWSASLAATAEVTIKESLIVEGMEAKISLTEKFTMGSTKTESVSQSIASPCGGKYDSSTWIHFTSNIAMYTVPVTLTYSHCGVETTAPGTITSTEASGSYDCGIFRCTSGVCAETTGCADSIV